MAHVRTMIVLAAGSVLWVSRAPALQVDERPYQTSVSAIVDFIDADTSEAMTYDVLVTGFYPQVEPSDDPVQERPFAQRAGNVSALAGLVEFTFEIDGGELEFDGEVYAGNLRLAHATSPLALEIVFILLTADGSDSTTADFGGTPITVDMTLDQEFQRWGGRLSSYVADRAAIGVEYDLTTTETQSAVVLGPPVNATLNLDSETEATRIGVRGKYVVPLADPFSLNAELGAAVIEVEDKTGGAPEADNHEFFGEADWYLNRYLSIGAGVTVNNGDDKSEKGATYMGRVRFNYGVRFGAAIEVGHFAVDDSGQGEDETSFSITLLVRG